jgi:hypothetical protein
MKPTPKRKGRSKNCRNLGLISRKCLSSALFGAAFFVIPGIGPIVVAGPLVAWIVGALGAGLYSIGIPKDSVMKYETALKSDHFLLVAHGTAEEVTQASDILHTTHPRAVGVHSAELEHAGVSHA